MSREMKHSGIEWIGEIPKGWNVARIKTIFKERTELSETGKEKLLSVSEYYGVDSRASRIDEGEYLSRSESLVGYKKCYERDFVSNIMLAWKGSFGVTKIDGIVSPAYCVYQPSDSIYSYYYHYLFRTSLYTTRFKLFSRGIIDSRLRLYSPYFYDIEAIIPPLSEQQKIANYLDKVCGEVDEMIALQEQMIEELKAYKQSIITEAVTKGLNPNVPMKDSGIDWIGKVPEHWEIRRIKNLFTLRDEKNYKPMDEVQLLSLYTGIGVFPHGEQEERGNKAITVEGYKVVHKDDIVVNIILAWMGAIGVSNYDGVTSPAYDVYIPDLSKVIPHFFHYVFRTQGIAGECYKYGRGIMMMRWRTYSSEFKQIRVPYPSLKEQQSIASYLDTKCAEIDALIAIKQAKIEELKDYKKSVIYEYVTGKKEVV